MYGIIFRGKNFRLVIYLNFRYFTLYIINLWNKQPEHYSQRANFLIYQFFTSCVKIQ